MSSCLRCLAIGLALASSALALNSVKTMASSHLMQAQIPADAEEVTVEPAATDELDMMEATGDAKVTNATKDTENNVTAALASEVEALTDSLVWEVWEDIPKQPDGTVNSTEFEDNFGYIKAAFLAENPQEVTPAEYFRALDTNGDGILSLEEWFNGMGNLLFTEDNGVVKDQELVVSTGPTGNGGTYVATRREVHASQEFVEIPGSSKCEPWVDGAFSHMKDSLHCMSQCQHSPRCMGITFFLDDRACYLFKSCKNTTVSQVRAVSFRKVGVTDFVPVLAPYNAPSPPSESVLDDIVVEDNGANISNTTNSTGNETLILDEEEFMQNHTDNTKPDPCAPTPAPPEPYTVVNATQAPLVEPLANSTKVESVEDDTS